jgi:hypothetical protein
MSLQCPEPDLQTAVLNELRESATLAPELALHLDGCAACQIAVERMKRMGSVWGEDHVDEAAVADATRTFHTRRLAERPAPRWFDLVPFASAGVAAGYLLLAATGAVSTPWKSRHATEALPKAPALAITVAAASGAGESTGPRSAPAFATTEEGAKWVRARPHIETARGVAPLVDGLRLQLGRGESARVALAAGHASKVEGPCLVEFWSTPLEASGWRMVREESAEPPAIAHETAGASNARPLVAVPSGSGVPRSRSLAEGMATARELAGPDANVVSARAWARAAAALREDDFDAADRAFDELGHTSEPATRDAARLARAQLWISRGRGAAVRPVLEQLAQSGATPLVRQRAAEFLNRDNQ